MEMTCFCEHCKCEETINYIHHRDWSSEEDFCCENCVEKHYQQ